MSYNASIFIPTGAGNYLGEDCGNYTYNVSPMYRRAFENEKGINSLNGMNCEKAIPILEKAIEKMENNMALFYGMNPDNGWGNYSGALDFLNRILQGCKKHPKAFVKVS